MPHETLNVYVSSTWIDMQAERAAVLDVTSRLRGFKFLGMEFFGSRDETTARTSVEQIDRADVYVGIVGHRYGSGITEQEYSRAHERGVPAFIYLRNQADGVHASSNEDDSARSRLEAFRNRLLLDHTCSEFIAADDLAAKLTADLHNWMFERHVSRGLSNLSADYLSRVQAFIAEYVGDRNLHVPFGGRDEELRELDQWLEDPDAPRFLLLAAGAGKGKSALLVRWTRTLLTRDDIVPVFFPISIRFRTNLASVVFPSLATWLAALHRESLKTTPDTPPEVWRGLMTDLLARPLRDGRRLVLIVDGLDEAADWTAGADLFPPHVSRHARVVVAARFLAGDADAGDWRRRLGWDSMHAARTLTLSPLRIPGVAEVLNRMGFPLAALGERSEIVDELYRLSQGEPLIVRLYVDDLLSRGDVLARLRVEDLRTIEPGLGGFFARWWDDQRRLWGASRPLQERRVQALMNFLACALGPLTRDDLFALARPIVELNTWTLEEALEPLQRFIVGDGVENGYVYSHPGLAIHFRDRLSRSERELLDTRIAAWCKESIEAVTPRHDSAGDLSAYVLQYFGAHLERLDADVVDFAPLLSDGWRRAWHARDGSYAGYRADLRRVQLAASRQAGSKSARLADSVVLEVRTALCVASVDQLSDHTPPELVVALVEKGVWSRAGALGYARLIRDPIRRAKALVNLASFLHEPTQTLVLREVLEALALVPDEAKVPLLARVSAVLPNPLVSDAWSLALAIGNRALMVDAIQSLVERLTPSHVDRTIAVISRLGDLELRRRAFTALAARHPQVFESWLSGACELDPWEQAWILVHVADGVTPDAARAVLDRATEMAARVSNEAARLDLFLSISNRIARTDLAPRIERIHRELAAVSHPATRAATFVKLAALVDRAAATDMAHAALEACAHIPSESTRADTIVALAPMVGDTHVDRALGLTAAIEDVSLKARASGALLPYLDGETRQWALNQILSVEDPFERLCLAAPVADHVPAQSIADAFAELGWNHPISPLWRFRLIRMLAPRMQSSVEDLLSSEVDPLEDLAQCAAIARFCAPGVRVSLDARVVSTVGSGYPFSGDRLEEALGFLVHWAADARDQALGQVTEAVLQWRAASVKIATLDALSSFLPAAVLETAVRRLQTIGDDDIRRETEMRCLAVMSPDVVMDRLRSVWERAAAADKVAQLLQWLKDHAGNADDLRRDIIRLVPQVDGSSTRADAIAMFMRHVGATVTGEELTVLVDAALSLEGTVTRASTMSWLVPHIHPENVDHFAEIFGATLDDSDEASSSAVALASRLAPDRLLDVIEEQFSAELQAGDWDAYEKERRLLGLMRVARRLDEPLRSTATDRLLRTVEAASESRRYAILIQFGRWLEVDHEFYDRFFALAATLGPRERIEAGLPFLRNLGARRLGAAIGELVSWVDQDFPKSDQAHAISAAVSFDQQHVLSLGAWKAALVIESLPRLLPPDAAALAALAYDDLRAHDVAPATAAACAALLPFAPSHLRDGLIGLAIEGIRHRDGATTRAGALRALTAALSGDVSGPANFMAALAPYVDGEHLDRFIELVDTTIDEDDETMELIADLSARISPDAFLRAFAVLSSRALRSDADTVGIARRLSALTRMALRLDERTRAAALDHIVSELTPHDHLDSELVDVASRRKHDIVTRIGSLVSAGPDVFARLFSIARRFPDDQRISAAASLLGRAPLTNVHGAIREVISWVERLPQRRQSRTVAGALQEPLATHVAAAGAWRAALVLECVSTSSAVAGSSSEGIDWKPAEPPGASADADSLIALALEDLRAHGGPLTTAAIGALMPHAPEDLRDAFVDVALDRLRHVPGAAAKARALAGLAAYAPTRSIESVVAEVLEQMRTAESQPDAANPIAGVLRELLGRVNEVQASLLLQAALEHGTTYSVLEAFVEHVPEAAIVAAGETMARLIACETGLRRAVVLQQWIDRLPLAGLERLPHDVQKTNSSTFIALALSHAVARVPRDARDRFKALALDALTSNAHVPWDDLVTLQRAAGPEPWPALGSLMAAALRRETSPYEVMQKAWEVLPSLTDRAGSEVAAQALGAMAATLTEGVAVRDLDLMIPGEQVHAVLGRIIAAGDSPARRYAILLPFVRPLHRKALIHAITASDRWMDDPRVLDPLSEYLVDPDVAHVLASRIAERAPGVTGPGLVSGQLFSERAIHVWADLRSDSPAWHPMFVYFLFSESTRSRADLMRLLQKTVPTLRQSLGTRTVESIIDSLESAAEWWP